jgi:hypothetical protein
MWQRATLETKAASAHLLHGPVDVDHLLDGADK